MIFCRLLIFSNVSFLENSFRNIIRESNSLDPEQARHFELGPNCLRMKSADGTRRRRVEITLQFGNIIYLPWHRIDYPIT